MSRGSAQSRESQRIHERKEVPMTEVCFPEGTVVTARALFERQVDVPDRDFGLYLDRRWAPSWPAMVIDWEDFGLPLDWHRASEKIATAFHTAQAGRRLEIGCVGGIGRTGTVLACMAVLAGVEARDAVGWVREHYRRDAVETAEQERWVRWFSVEILPASFQSTSDIPADPSIDEYLESLGYSSDRVGEARRIRGLTNENYLVEVDGEELIVRIASPNAARLGVNRLAELSALRAADVIGLGPEIVHFSLPDGHLVTRRICSAPFEAVPEAYRTEESLNRVVAAVKRIHTLPRIEHRFDPFDRISRILDEARTRELELPPALPRLTAQLERIRRRWDEGGERRTALCHNDLFAGNLLSAQPIRIIDWEFCGMNDPIFDVATLVVACGENAPLPQELQDVLIKAYTGAVGEDERNKLSDMVFVVRFHAGCWGIAQRIAEWQLPADAGFTYGEYTEWVLNALIQDLGV